jgi:hypothetical protein
LMFSSLGAYRGAIARCFGVPKASATLDHKRSVWDKLSMNTGSSVLAKRSSRRIIPKQFAAVRIELMGKRRSIRSDKENSFAIVGKARAESVTRKPDAQIPDLFEVVDNWLKGRPSVWTEEARDIFHDNPWRSNFSSKVCKRKKQSASSAVDAFSLSVSMADILAGPTASPELRFGNVFCFERRDIVMKWDLRPMPFQNTLTIWVDFTMKYRFHAGALKPKIEAAYTSEEWREAHL